MDLENSIVTTFSNDHNNKMENIIANFSRG